MDRGTVKNTAKDMQQKEHAYCVLCGQKNRRGLKLNFRLMGDGSVEASTRCSKRFQGYRNVVHGGVIAALLDSAMTNCLFAHNIKALTAELKVRFSSPVNTKNALRVRALIEKTYGHFYVLKAELFQNHAVKAKATGRFITCL